MAVANTANGYQQPIIGWMHDLHTITRDEIYAWYKTWYVPNNAILIVVGAVDHQNVFALAQTYFGNIASKPVPRTPVMSDIEPLGERRLTVNVKAQVPALYMGFNVPSINTTADQADIYALRLLAGVLDGGFSARLETELVRNQRIASSASAGYGGFALGDTLFVLNGVPAANHSMTELEAALLGEIERLQTDLADPAELQRVRAQVISGIVYQQDSIASQAIQIGRLESIGRSWREMDLLPAKLQAVTPEQLRDVARKYLTPERRTVAYLQPTSR
jgi:zinc protease